MKFPGWNVNDVICSSFSFGMFFPSYDLNTSSSSFSATDVFPYPSSFTTPTAFPSFINGTKLGSMFLYQILPFLFTTLC